MRPKLRGERGEVVGVLGRVDASRYARTVAFVTSRTSAIRLRTRRRARPARTRAAPLRSELRRAQVHEVVRALQRFAHLRRERHAFKLKISSARGQWYSSVTTRAGAD